MGLVNRVVPAGDRHWTTPWRGVASWPPSPRPVCATTALSALAQWGLPVGDALRVEFRHRAGQPAVTRCRGRRGPVRRRGRAVAASAVGPDALRTGPAADARRGRLRLRRHPDRRWQRLRLPGGRAPAVSTVAAATAAPRPPPGPWRAGGRRPSPTRPRNCLFGRVLAGVAASTGSIEWPDRFARRPPGPAPPLRGAEPLRLAPATGRSGGHRVGLAGGLRPGGRRRSSVPTGWWPPGLAVGRGEAS